ncbi:MAG: response regulator [Bacteroidetes bacterium]|nr:response regulator [Bacteroidota bacterium]
MKKINTFIIEDEISAINTLRGMLSQYFPQINIMEEARSVSDALFKIQRSQPDLVFLDIEMPPFGNGFDFLEKCPNPNFGVIFVTAYPNYAVKAINHVQPWGYLVKPYSIAELSKAIEKATEKMKEAHRASLEKPETQGLLISDARKGNIAFKAGDIVYCQADGATTDIFYLKDGKTSRFKASKTLKDIEEQLPSQLFCRCHHSYLVNLGFIERYAHTGRNGIIYLQTGAKVGISVGKMESFETQFSEFLRLDS